MRGRFCFICYKIKIDFNKIKVYIKIMKGE